MKFLKFAVSLLLVFLIGVQSQNKEEIVVDKSIDMEIAVTFEGAVKEEKSYIYKEVMTIQEALQEVELTKDADLSVLDLEREIYHEMLIYIPKKDEHLISLNHATLEELKTIPGIGDVKAQLIIDQRPYECLEDIMKVKGIKEKSYRKFRPYLTL